MTQEFILHTGVRFDVEGHTKLLNALREAQAEIQLFGTASKRAMQDVGNAMAAYNQNLTTRQMGARVAAGQKGGAAFGGALGDVAKSDKQIWTAVSAEMDKYTRNTETQARRRAAALKEEERLLREQARAAKEYAKEVEQAYTYVGIALAALGKKTVDFSYNMALTASRAEELDVVLRNMGHILGYDIQTLKSYEEAIKGLNIRTDAAREALLLFMRMNLDVSKAVEMARLAQDAAVIGMEDSSDALQGIMHGIMTLQPRVLRTHGIIVNLDMAYSEYTESMNRTVESLTMEEKQEIALNEVLKQGIRLRGTYESAMTTASKQLRSLKREAYETTRQFGEGLVPALSLVAQAGQGLNDFLQTWPAGLKGAISSTIAFTGALMVGVGALIVYKKQIDNVRNSLIAIQVLQKGGPLGLGGLGLAATAVGVSVAIVSALQAIKQAQDQQAASAIDVSQYYGEYIATLDKAKGKNVELAWSIWQVIEAQRAQGNAPTGDEIAAAMREIGDVIVALPATGVADQFKEMSDRALEYAADEEQLTKIIERRVRVDQLMGMTHKELTQYILELVRAERARRVALAQSIAWDDRHNKQLSKGLQLYTEAQRRINALTQAVEDLNTAMSGGLTSRYSDFLGGLAGGIADLSGIDQSIEEVGEKFSDAMKDVGRDLSKQLKDVAAEIAKMVPGATAEEARLEQGILGLGTWDEWARRWAAAQDFVFSEQEKGWLEFTQAQVAGTKWALLEGETSYEWMARLREGFYAGDAILIEKFANKQTASWKWLEIQRKEAADAEIAEAQRVAGEKARQAQIERDRELEDLQRKRKMKLIELALELADSTGSLKDWATTLTAQWGPQFAGAFDEASEVLALIQADMLDVAETPGLKELLDKFGPGLLTNLKLSKERTGENTAEVDSLTASWENASTAMMGYFNILGAQGLGAADRDVGLIGLGQWRQNTMGTTGLGPTAALSQDLQAFPQLLTDLVGGFQTLADKALVNIDDIGAEFGTMGQKVWLQWLGHSIIPDLIQGFGDWGIKVKDVVELTIMPALEKVAAILRTIMGILAQPLTGAAGGLPITPPIDEGEVGTGYGAGPMSGASPSGPVRQSTMQQIAGQMEMLPQNIATEISHAPIVSGAGAGMGGGTFNSEVYYMQFSDPAAWAMAQMTVANNRRARLDSRMVG